MTITAIRADSKTANPLDLIEQFLSVKEWVFDRRGEDEMVVEVPSQWCNLGLFLAWSEELGALHLSCAFDMRVPEGRRAAVFELLAHLNERMWLGHFALWTEEGAPMFRHTVLLGERRIAADEARELMDIAIGECDRFYPAFQFVIWGGKSPAEAIAAALLDTAGEA
ncbi:YbjN domain-containing protein [Roseospira visakhapatnamensis]|uniref:YbjN domain-containing protein n=1 Tax=Roseospira visakhapatnamensis TaxID=390880 RepID=A0A7W6REK8_9PROT|nr:YbjN domain-containing protein [Roseospira visakhapatnamensis]MBB4266925.1 hypothetical protein [Roseospira visakhapatnamensis]